MLNRAHRRGFVAELRKLGYKRIIVCDTEYDFGTDVEGKPIEGNPLRPLCICAKDLLSNESWEFWAGEFPATAPFPVDETTLFIAFNASAEIRTFNGIGWDTPVRILDLFAEFCDHRNGRDGDTGRSLLAALEHFGLDTVGTVYKKNMIDRILKGAPFSDSERREIADYCWSDVYALERLLEAMLPNIVWKGALLRGRYACAVAAMEDNGIPVNVALLNEVVGRWADIQGGLIREIDRDYGVYDGTTFKAERFEAFVERAGLPWPRLKSGALALDSETFHDMARVFPIVAPLAELRKAIGHMRKNAIPVGDDGRARTGIRPFASSTSRNQPSTSQFLYGNSKWVRFFIQPEPGRALLYFDYSAEEVGIAAALSGDEQMKRRLPQRRFLRELRRCAWPAPAWMHQGDCGGAIPRYARQTEDRLPGDVIRHGRGVIGDAHRQTDSSGRGLDTATPPALRDVLEFRTARHRSFDARRFARDGTRLASASLQRSEPALNRQLSDPGQRRGNLACRLLSGHRSRLRGLRASARRDAGSLQKSKTSSGPKLKSPGMMTRASQVVLSGFALKVGIEETRYPNHLTDDAAPECGAPSCVSSSC